MAKRKTSASVPYRYAVVSYQRSLHERDEAVPFAVLVEGENNAVVVGKHLVEFDDLTDPISSELLGRFPEVLINELRRQIRSGRREDLIGGLAEVFRWNVFLSDIGDEPSTLTTDELAYALFARFVDTADDTRGRLSHGEQNIFKAQVPTWAPASSR